MTNRHVERFNSAAQDYATDRYPGRAQCMRAVSNLLEPHAEDVILDVGCGTGSQLLGLSPSIKQGYGIDPAEEMIRQAAQLASDCPNLQFYVGSAEHLPEDVLHLGVNKIISNYALHHLDDSTKRRAILSLAAVLPDDGLFVLGDLMFSDNPDVHQALFDRVGYGPGCDTPSQIAFLEDAFTQAGLLPQTHVLNPLVAVIAGRKV